jgi:hypothetical protein
MISAGRFSENYGMRIKRIREMVPGINSQGITKNSKYTEEIIHGCTAVIRNSFSLYLAADIWLQDFTHV